MKFQKPKTAKDSNVDEQDTEDNPQSPNATPNPAAMSKQSRKSPHTSKKKTRAAVRELGGNARKSTTITKTWPQPNTVDADTATMHVYSFLRKIYTSFFFSLTE